MATFAPSPRRSNGHPSTSSSSDDWQSSYSQLKPAPLRLGSKDKADAEGPSQPDNTGQDSFGHRPDRDTPDPRVDMHQNRHKHYQRSSQRLSEKASVAFVSIAETTGDDVASGIGPNATSDYDDPTSPTSSFRFIEQLDKRTSKESVPESSSTYSPEASSMFRTTVFSQHVQTLQKPEDGKEPVPRRPTPGLDWPLSTTTVNWISSLERSQRVPDPQPQYDELEVELGGWSEAREDSDVGHVAELRTHFEAAKRESCWPWRRSNSCGEVYLATDDNSKSYFGSLSRPATSNGYFHKAR